MIDIHSRVKELCAQKGIKLLDLCNSMNVTRQSFNESLKNNPKLSRLEEVAFHLGVEVRDLFETGKPTETSEVGKIICPHCGKTIFLHTEK